MAHHLGGRDLRGRCSSCWVARCACARWATRRSCPPRRRWRGWPTRRSSAGRTCSPRSRPSTATGRCWSCRGCPACSPGSSGSGWRTSPCAVPGSPRCCPVLGMTVVLSGAIVLGVRHPQSLLLQGSVFAALALAWLAIRARRASAAVQGGSTSYLRGAGAVVMLALAAGVAFPASALIGDDDDERAVARNWVEPPFDIGRYPSPLAGFRKYIDLQGRNDPSNVYDKTLLDIQGVAHRHAHPVRRHGPLRRHGLGRHATTRSPGRRTTPSSACRPRSTTPCRGTRSRRPSPSARAGRASGSRRSARCGRCRSRPVTRVPRQRCSATTSPPPPPSCRAAWCPVTATRSPPSSPTTP